MIEARGLVERGANSPGPWVTTPFRPGGLFRVEASALPSGAPEKIAHEGGP